MMQNTEVTRLRPPNPDPVCAQVSNLSRQTLTQPPDLQTGSQELEATSRRHISCGLGCACLPVATEA